MNGRQIESFFSLIDSNLDEIDEEAARYIEAHLAELASSLKERGFAFVRTRSGSIRLEKSDLAVCA